MTHLNVLKTHLLCTSIYSSTRLDFFLLQSAVDSAVAMNDLSVIVDLLGVLTLKP